MIAMFEVPMVVIDKETLKEDTVKCMLTYNDLISIKRFSQWIGKDEKRNRTMLFYINGDCCLLDSTYTDFKKGYYEFAEYSKSFSEQNTKRDEPITKGRFRTFGEAFINLFKVSKTN